MLGTMVWREAGWDLAFLYVADSVFPGSFGEPAGYQVPVFAFLAKVEAIKSRA